MSSGFLGSVIYSWHIMIYCAIIFGNYNLLSFIIKLYGRSKAIFRASGGSCTMSPCGQTENPSPSRWDMNVAGVKDQMILRFYILSCANLTSGILFNVFFNFSFHCLPLHVCYIFFSAAGTALPRFFLQQNECLIIKHLESSLCRCI